MFGFQKDLSESLRFVNPRYYNLLTKLLLICGIGLLTQPIWKDIIDSVLQNIGIDISDGYHPNYGVLVIIISLIFNGYSQSINLKWFNNAKDIPQKEISTCRVFENFTEVCQSLIPLIDDNKYVFKSFGPNSSANNSEPLRYDMELWHESRIDYIIPNNDIISCIITKNKTLIPLKYRSIFDNLNSHIYAFKKHVENPDFDYSSHQFPPNIENCIKDVCFEENLNSQEFINISNWLSKKLSFKEILERRVFGSFLFSTTVSKDLDLALFLNISDDVSVIKLSKRLKNLIYKFKIRFKKPIHLTVFLSHENIEYEEFINKNPYNYIVDGKKFALFNITFR